MKPRDLVDLVRPDHVPTLMIIQPHLRMLNNGGQKVVLRCSCGYGAALMQNIEFAVDHPDVSTGLREQWLRIEMTEHLLDQELWPDQILDLLKEA